MHFVSVSKLLGSLLGKLQVSMLLRDFGTWVIGAVISFFLFFLLFNLLFSILLVGSYISFSLHPLFVFGFLIFLCPHFSLVWEAPFLLPAGKFRGFIDVDLSIPCGAANQGSRLSNVLGMTMGIPELGKG